MNVEGLVERKKSGKDVLTSTDMSAISGIDKLYLETLMKQGFLNPPHFSAKYAVNGVELQGGDLERVETHERVLTEKTKGQYPKGAIREMATSKMVEEKKKNGQPIFYKMKEKSAEEVFTEFLDSPAGRPRILGKLRRESKNIAAGGSWDEGPQGLVAMPANYENVLWDTTRQEAARLQVLAMTGDQTAAKKYNMLREKWPELLPELKIDGK